MRMGMMVLLGTFLMAIPLSLAAAEGEERNITGEWAGTAVNSDGGTNSNTLVIREHREGRVTGKWGPAGNLLEIERGERVTDDVFQWESSAGKGHYRVRCNRKGRSLVLDWTFTYREGEEIRGYTGTTVLSRK